MNNISRTSNAPLDLSQLVTPSPRISARELHKYVLGLVGIFMLFVITYSIAIHRVERQSRVTKEGVVPDAIAATSKSLASPSSK